MARIEGRYEAAWPSGTGPAIRVVAIGDSSLTADGLDDPSQLWLQRALDGIHRRKARPLELVVLAESGARLDGASRQALLVDEERPDVVVVCVGTNDATHLQPTVLIDYESRYRQLLRLVRDPRRVVIAAGVGNLAYSPVLWSSLRRMAQIAPAAASSWYVNRAIRRATAGVADVQFMSTRAIDPVMWTGRDHLYDPDHFHPSAAGHEVWAALAHPFLEEAIRAIENHAGPDEDGGVGAGVPAPGRSFSYVRTTRGVARVRDGGGTGPAVIVMPDSPNVLEHHESTFRELGNDFRVVGLEMPGAGYTDLRRYRRDDPLAGGAPPTPRFDYSLEAGATWILDVMDELGIEHAILTASCVNGLYAAMAAQLAPERVDALVLCQTPSLGQLKAWSRAQIPRPLRNRAVGDLIVRVGRRPLAAYWYRSVVATTAPLEVRKWFEDLAYLGFRRGAAWRLAPLVHALMHEPDESIGELTPPTTLLWGTEDRSHLRAGTVPESAPGPPTIQRVATGHFPDLEDPRTFAAAVRAAAGLDDPLASRA